MAMRKLLFIVTLAGLIGVFATAAPAWASPGQDQFAGVSGSGTLGQFGDPTATLGAAQTPVGPEGSFAIGYPDGTFMLGSATCVFVSGNTAYLTGRIYDSGGPRVRSEGWFPGSYIVIGVKAPNLLNWSPGFAVNPGCGPNGAATPVFPIVRGGYRVFGG